MNSWDPSQIDVRRKATEAFCRFLDHPINVGLRQDLIDESKAGPSEKAKNLFAAIGGFYLEGQVPHSEQNTVRPIPKETVFRIFDEEPFIERDKLVTLVLPKSPMRSTAEFEATEHYRCTYWPYISEVFATQSPDQPTKSVKQTRAKSPAKRRASRP